MRMRRMLTAALAGAALAGATLATACRDIDVMNEREEFDWGSGPARQLTYNTGRDGEPSWAPDGDSIYCSAEAFPGVIGARGVLLAVPAEGGTARPVFPFLHAPQVGGPAFHVAPAVSPDGERIAFIDITAMAAPTPCTGSDGACPGVEPLLERGRLIVRDRDENSSRAPRSHAFSFPGRGPQGGLDRAFPYFADFQIEGRVGFSIAWAPDSERLVFSDGTRLYMWQPESGGAPQPVPNTEFGVHPTWSADGELIAFTRQAPFDSVDAGCACGTGGVARSTVRRVYTGNRSLLTVIRPDGTLVRELGVGEDPAFGPDGALYASSLGRLVRVDPTTGASVPIAGGDSGHSPAPSPDGSRLAFMKLANGGYDIWVVDLGGD